MSKTCFFETTALNICKQGPSAIWAKDREEFGRILGTDIIVQLPKDGAQIDTVTLGSSKRNQHTLNN